MIVKMALNLVFYLLVSLRRYFSKIIPSFFTIKEGFFLPLRLSCKESSTSNQAFLLRRKDVTALRCSKPLRSKVGGPSKVFAMFCGMGPPGDNDTICQSLMLIYISLRKTKTNYKYIVISSLTLLQIPRNLQRS